MPKTTLVFESGKLVTVRKGGVKKRATKKRATKKRATKRAV